MAHAVRPAAAAPAVVLVPRGIPTVLVALHGLRALAVTGVVASATWFVAS